MIMQAVIRLMVGISELHRRDASPMRCHCASALKENPRLASVVNENATAAPWIIGGARP
ncbi:MAG TPA: hypothetical protein VFS91_02650 [Nitrobacter sp.]|nr:hypothetical protein [Nitrobacter sp.]